MGVLACKVSDERFKCLIDNEKHIAKGFESSDDEDEDGDDDDEADGDDPDAAFDNMRNKLKAFKNGKPQDGDDISDDDGDSDYEENAGEFSLYDSPLEEVDELEHIK